LIRTLSLLLSVVLVTGLSLQCFKAHQTSNEYHVDLPVLLNLDHALSLTKSIKHNYNYISYISIYADAPDYAPVEATGEGISCVDDVGRFLEVLAVEFRSKPELLETIRGLTRYLLAFANDDGTWYNFLLTDGTINQSHQNSLAKFDWWAVRGLRGLSAAWEVFSPLQKEQTIADEIRSALLRSVSHIENITNKYPEMISRQGGLKPGWLLDNAPDKTSELLLAVVRMHKNGLYDFSNHINILAEGLMGWQFVDSGHELNGMYFCWNNIWHSWGNNQAFALLQAYSITGESGILESVRIWADNFVPYLIKTRFPRKLTIDNSNQFKVENYPQIAYGTNSVYQGIRSFAELTGEKQYYQSSEQVFSWYTGNNIAGVGMYDSQTGRCYDGINSSNDVNHNSGAESTVECLQSIQRRGIFK